MKLTEKQYQELGKFFIDLGKGIAIGMFGFATFSNWALNYFVLFTILTGIVVFGCVTIGLVLIENK